MSKISEKKYAIQKIKTIINDELNNTLQKALNNSNELKKLLELNYKYEKERDKLDSNHKKQTQKLLKIIFKKYNCHSRYGVNSSVYSSDDFYATTNELFGKYQDKIMLSDKSELLNIINEVQELFK